MADNKACFRYDNTSENHAESDLPTRRYEYVVVPPIPLGTDTMLPAPPALPWVVSLHVFLDSPFSLRRPKFWTVIRTWPCKPEIVTSI